MDEPPPFNTTRGKGWGNFHMATRNCKSWKNVVPSMWHKSPKQCPGWAVTNLQGTITHPTLAKGLQKLNAKVLWTCWDAPRVSSSHHTDCYIFAKRSRNKSSFATIASWVGFSILREMLVLLGGSLSPLSNCRNSQHSTWKLLVGRWNVLLAPGLLV